MSLCATAEWSLCILEAGRQLDGACLHSSILGVPESPDRRKHQQDYGGEVERLVLDLLQGS